MTDLVIAPIEALVRRVLPGASLDDRRTLVFDLVGAFPLPPDAPEEVRQARTVILDAVTALIGFEGTCLVRNIALC